MTKVTSLSLDDESIAQGKILAAYKGLSLSSFVRMTLKDLYRQFEEQQRQQLSA